MEGRALSDTAVDEIGKLGMVQGKHIRFRRREQRRWSIGELTKDRLAADHHDFGGIGDRAGGTDQMLKL